MYENIDTKIDFINESIFIPLNQEVENNIEDFVNEQVIFLKGKFIAHEGWYSVTATSIKVLHEMNFDTMPAIGISAVLTGVTTQTVRNENGYSVLDFNIDEYLGDLAPKNFWLEVKHKANSRYLINKTRSINQNSRSTTAILVGIIKNVPPINDPVTNLEISLFKFVLDLEDISLIYNNDYNNQTNNNQTINAPWLNPRRPNSLNSSPLPNMNVLNSQQEQPEQSEQSKPPTKTIRKTRTTNLLNLSDNIQSDELNNIQINQVSDQIFNTQLIQTPSMSLPPGISRVN
ncbi:hypothetical protein Glove_198g113 [Diversispora epigaea]|uniref:Uncharacterized protein n=1 Tax=Diversispora epigaea TaxID=1348612 RepID=A0A397IKE6_9GLOM|nr:hypothetical protein Glove_198g113 [Diversispora epigaea]